MRHLRRQAGRSIASLAKEFSVSKGKLSEIENGLRSLPACMFGGFCVLFEVDFQDDGARLAEMRMLLGALFNGFLRLDDVAIEQAKSQYEQARESFFNTPAHFHVWLADYLIESALNKKENLRLFENLQEVEDVFSPDEQGLIYFLKGLRYRKAYELDCDNDMFEEAKDRLNSQQLPGLAELIQYYEVQASMKNSNPFDAYILCTETRKYFSAVHNYLRCLYLDNTEALCLIACHQLGSALKQLDTLLTTSSYILDDYLRFCVIQNKFMVLSLLGRYDETLALMKEEEGIFTGEGLSCFFLAPYCEYMLGNTEKAMEGIRRMRPYACYEEEFLLFSCVEAAIAASPALDGYAEKMLAFCRRRNDYELAELTYKFLSRYYTMHDMPDKLLDVQRKYILFLNR